MGSKKLIRNVLVMLSTIMMTTVMVLSSCGNAADSEYAEVTINMGGSGSARAISAEEKSAATFNVYFNDSLVASNVKGTYNGTAQVGTRLNIRLDAILNGKRIARGENTITVRSPSNDVDVTLYENREEIKPPVGSIIMKDGSYLTKEQITSENQADTVAVVYKVDTNARKAWAVGKVLSSSTMAWATNSAEGYSKNITDLREQKGYTDGSTGLEKLRTAVNDATTDELLKNNYPAWDYACNYGKNQGLDSFQTGWYLPCKQELQEVYNNKAAIDAALAQLGVSKALSSGAYWSSSQVDSNSGTAYLLNFISGNWANANSKTGNSSVCAVRQFTF